MRHLLILTLIMLTCFFAACKTETAESNHETEQQEALAKEIDEPSEKEPEAEKPATTQEAKLPLAKFSYTWNDSEDMPDVVIIVDDFGNDGGALLRDFAQLPSEVVFAVLPDLPFTKKAGELAAQNGHEVLIHTPMQAVSNTSATGSKYIKSTSTAEEINAILADFHAQLPMASAANNHTGSSVTANKEAMTAILKQLHALGLYFVDSATTGVSLAPSLARSMGYPALKRDIFLDVPDMSDATLASKISSLSKYKGRQEPVIIITHCHNRAKLEGLQKFIAQIQGMGLRLTTLARAKNIAV